MLSKFSKSVLLSLVIYFFSQLAFSESTYDGYQLSITSALPAYFESMTEEQKSISVQLTYKEEGKKYPKPAMTFTNLGTGDSYYALYSDMQIRSFNLATKQYLGGWILDGYADNIIMAGEQMAAAEKMAAALGHSYTHNPDVTAATPRQAVYFLLNDDEHGQKDYGCLVKHPLRYSDIDKDGQTELVLNIGSDLVIFSTVLHKVISSTTWREKDEATPNEADQFPAEFLQSATAPTYIAASGVDPIREVFPAWRSFAKLYFNDFDADGAFDIVVWRKLYESRLNSDPVKGFAKKGDLLVHYKLVNGEYKKQNTEQAVIKGWLTAKQLTWSKGYPNKSECAGQENQLIPEMHDPLLNDPEVLQ